MKYSLRYKLANFRSRYGYNHHAEAQPDVLDMQRAIDALENKSINFAIQTYPDGSWIAKSTNVDGILTGGRNQGEANELIKDAIFTYYGVKPEHCKDVLLRNTGEPVTTEQTVQVTA